MLISPFPAHGREGLGEEGERTRNTLFDTGGGREGLREEGERIRNTLFDTGGGERGVGERGRENTEYFI